MNDKKVNEKRNKENISNSIDSANSYILDEKEKLFAEEKMSQEVKDVLDDIFLEMISTDSENEIKKVSNDRNINNLDSKNYESDSIKPDINEVISEGSNKAVLEENDEINPKFSNVIENKALIKEEGLPEKINELQASYENRFKDLVKKDEEYNRRYKKLEKKTQEYEDRNYKLLEKRKEYEKSIKEFEQKSRDLEDTKEELEKRNNNLREAREQFTQLSKQLEEKKIELEKREKKVDKLQQSLEKTRLELEKSKIEFEKDKLELEIERSEAEEREKELNVIEPIDKLKKEKDLRIAIEKKVESKGKKERLEVLLHNLSYEGYFQSCFLIDNKGMLISEYSQIELDKMAIGAMFSLIGTSALRTVDSLRLQELLYFKLASVNGEFMIKNINIKNYIRNFILIAFYELSDSQIPKFVQKIDKKTIKSILKNIKRDFYEFFKESKINWAFDNLTERINFLKEKYKIPEGDVELIRKNVLNRVSVEIKELFEK